MRITGPLAIGRGPAAVSRCKEDDSSSRSRAMLPIPRPFLALVFQLASPALSIAQGPFEVEAVELLGEGW